VLVFFWTWNYFYGLTLAGRDSVYWEAAITLLFPLLATLSGWERHTNPRLRQLMKFESVYLLLCIIIKFLLLPLESHPETNFVQPSTDNVHPYNQAVIALDWCFVGFFVLQCGGFMVYQYQHQKYQGLLQSCTMAASLIIFRYNTWQAYPNGSVLDPYNRLLMWGRDAPAVLKAHYLLWVTNVLLVDYARYLPKLTIVIVHYTSVAFAWWTGEFWHIRLMTACHMFFLDGLSAYKQVHAISDDFCALPTMYQAWWQKHITPLAAIVATLGCLSCLAAEIACQFVSGCYGL